MKLMICILQDSDKDAAIKALTEEGFRVTALPSSGAYLRRGNTTLLVGMQDDLVQSAIDLIRASTSEPPEPGLKRATLFVLDVERFEQI